MGHHERRGHDLETKDASQGRILRHRQRRATLTFLLRERPDDPAQHLDQIGARAAARIEHVDILVRQPVGPAQFFAQHGVHAGDLILDDLRRGVPDTEFLAQFGIEGLEERFVEILDGVSFGELLEEFRAVHAVECGCGPVQHFHQAQRTQLGRGRDLLEEGLDHRDVERPSGGLPIKGFAAFGLFLVPEHPGGEHAVEERLHQGGAEEMSAFDGLELHAQGLLQRRPNGSERRQFSGRLDAGARVPGVGGEEESNVAWIVERRGMQQDALEVFGEALAQAGGDSVRLRGGGPEISFAVGQVKRLEVLDRSAGPARQQEKIPVVGEEDLAIVGEVILHLLGLRDFGQFLGRRFNLNDPARWIQAVQRSFLVAVLELVGSEKSAIWLARTAILDLDQATHFRFQRVTGGVKELRERAVAGGFPGGGSARVDLTQLVQI